MRIEHTAGVIRQTRTTPEALTLADLDAPNRVRLVYRTELERAPWVRQRMESNRLYAMLRTDGVRYAEKFAADLLGFRNAGAPVTAGRALLDVVTELHHDMYCGTSAPCVAELRRMELHADTGEDMIEGGQHIDGSAHTAAGKRAHAAALRQQAAASLELARALERDARALEGRRA